MLKENPAHQPDFWRNKDGVKKWLVKILIGGEESSVGILIGNGIMKP